MPRSVMILLVGVAVLLVGGIAATTLTLRDVRGSLTDTRASLLADWRTFGPEVVADNALWAKNPLLEARVGEDASPLLSAHVRWESMDGGQESVGPSPLPEPLIAALRGWAGQWPEHAEDAGVSDLDLTWMRGLEAYGYWDVEGVGSPMAEAPFVPLTESIPRFVDLQSIAKVRLMQGLLDGTHVAAAREVRELARLCLTTEQLVGEMVGVALLIAERKAHEAAVKRGLDVSGWEPVSEADGRRLQSALWAAQAPKSLLASGPLAELQLPVGSCAALREGIAIAHFLRNFVEQEVPERYAAYARELAESPCRLRRARKAWSENAAEGQLPATGQAFCQNAYSPPRHQECNVPDSAVLFPPVRSYIGIRLALLANQDWYRRYREP